MKQILRTLVMVSVLCIGLWGTARIVTENDWILVNSPYSQTAWRLRWQKSRRSAKTNSLSRINPTDQYDPILGWSPIPNLRQMQVGDSVINTNSSGMRGIKEYPIHKPPGVTRIAVIGDSYSWGENVEDDETFPAYLESGIENTEVLNFSVHGYGLDQIFLRFRTVVLKYHPDIVVIAYVYDDIVRSFLDFRDYQKPKFRLDGTSLHLTEIPVKQPEYVENTRNYALFSDFFSLLYERLVYRNEFSDRDKRRLADALFTAIAQSAKKENITPVFLYLPTGNEPDDQNKKLLSSETMQVPTCEKMKVLCLTARKYLISPSADRHESYDPTRHYSPEMNQIIAQGLAADLKTAYTKMETPELRMRPQ